MFQVLKNAWKIPELRKKMLYTLLLLVIFRFGSFIPVPGLNSEVLKELVSGNSNSIFGIMNTFSGGAFENATIFAMSITPYINSSIIIQLLTVAIPALERLSKEGEEGKKKIQSIVRFVTVALALIQAAGLYVGLQSAVENPSFVSFITIVTTFTAGTAFLMWLGEQINEKGIGNGISLIIFAGIISRGPSAIQVLYQTLVASKMGWLTVAIILIVALVVVTLVVYMNEAERRIPVQYAKRVVGRKMYGGQSTHIPIKLIGAGVMPIIFAMSIMSFPGTIAQFFGKNASNTSGFWGWVLGLFQSDSIFYAVVYFLLIIAFSYFYIAIQFNPIEIANNMKKNGGFVPGLRPGKPTSDYIAKILSRITLAGALFLGFIAVFPIVLSNWSPVNITIGGTSLLIVVGVALETTKQMESHMLMRHYKGFLE